MPDDESDIEVRVHRVLNMDCIAVFAKLLARHDPVGLSAVLGDDMPAVRLVTEYLTSVLNVRDVIIRRENLEQLAVTFTDASSGRVYCTAVVHASLIGFLDRMDHLQQAIGGTRPTEARLTSHPQAVPEASALFATLGWPWN